LEKASVILEKDILWPTLAYSSIRILLLELTQETPTTTQSTNQPPISSITKSLKTSKKNENPSDSTLSYNNALYARDYYKRRYIKEKTIRKFVSDGIRNWEKN
jgi:hypothetical protein